MAIQDFKNALSGGGARNNLYRVIGTFPSGAAGALGTVLGAAAGAAGGDVGGLIGAASNVIGAGGPARQLEFLCKAASLPASTIGMIEVPYRGRTVKYAGDRTFVDWNITIINDTDFSIRNAFESWSDLINSHEQNVGPSSSALYTQRWQVQQLDRSGSVLKTYSFEGCFPTEISQIDLSFDSNDQVEEFTVNMAYDLFTSDTTT